MPQTDGEKRILYWMLGAMLSLILAGLGWHAQASMKAIEKVENRLDALTRELIGR